jgi:myo-inositol-1(or 4)-monophosphatase
MVNLESCLDFALKIVKRASRELISGFGKVEERIKHDGTVVTDADKTSEQLIMKDVREKFPGWGIIAEESSSIYDGSEWTWVLDPLDGTNNYARLLPVFGISLALLHHGIPVVGVVDIPMLGNTFWAIKSKGAYRNGKILKTADIKRGILNNNHLFACCSRTWKEYSISLPFKPRVMGSAAYNLCVVASGIAVAGMEVCPKIWDVAAGVLILEQAGGVFKFLGKVPAFPIKRGTDYDKLPLQLITACDQTILGEIEKALISKSV